METVEAVERKRFGGINDDIDGAVFGHLIPKIR